MIRRTAARGGAAALLVGVLLLPGAWGPSHSGLRPGRPGQVIAGGDMGRGQALFAGLDCVQCHSLPRMTHGTNVPADLRLTGSRSPAPWTASYLLDPKPVRYIREHERPGLRMPAFSLTEQEARDLAAFLALQIDTTRVPARPSLESQLRSPAARLEGKSLYDQYQCAGCHALQGSGGEVGPALDCVGARRTPEYIAAMLEHPHDVVPGTAMKDNDLWKTEVAAITAYLVGLDKP